MTTAHHTLRMILAGLAFMLLATFGAAALSDPASAHVRSHDVNRMCQGHKAGMQHWHPNGLGMGFYYHTKRDYKRGGKVYFTTYKENRIYLKYDVHHHVYSC